jgi:hypothetical protein
MELEILKKKVSSYRTDGGHVRNVSDELLLEILGAWEQWTASGRDFARALGMNRNAIPKLIGKAKRLKREGFPSDGGFKEIQVESPGGVSGGGTPCVGIELGLPDGKVIRFPQVDSLLEFLKKAA